jgi:hypothetical protein
MLIRDGWQVLDPQGLHVDVLAAKRIDGCVIRPTRGRIYVTDPNVQAPVQNWYDDIAIISVVWEYI